MAKNSEYWKARMEALEEEGNRDARSVCKDIQEQFRRAENEIQMDIERWYRRLEDNNGISYAAAKKLLKKNELEEFHWSVEDYIKAGKENAVDQRWMKELENASAKVHISRLEAMKISLQQHAEVLYSRYEKDTASFLGKRYRDSYYHTAYEVMKGTGAGVDLHTIDTRKIDTVLTKPWAADGANFSDRIWKDKSRLIYTLHTELSQSIIRGDSPDKAIVNLSKRLNVSKNQSGRLIMTESAAISSVAARNCFQELDVEKYEIVATLDNLTSEICREMDGKVFPMSDYAVGLTAPPFHPFCRSTTIPYFDDEFTEGEQRAAREEESGKTYYVPADIDYKKWAESFVDNVSKQEDTNRADYLVRSHVPGQNISKERRFVNEVIISVPLIVQKALEGTIIDIGKDGASQYDYPHDILYVAKGAGKEDIIHEIGHMVENKILDKKAVAVLKENFIGDVPLNNIVQETYYDASNNPVDIFLLKSDKFVSDYQGRLYADDWSEIFDENWRIRSELLMEFISEPFREYIQNPKEMEKNFPEFYKLIKEAVE